MLRSADDKVRVEIADGLWGATPVPADFSIVAMPFEANKVAMLANNLVNSPTMRHVSLVVNRAKKKERIRTYANSIKLEEAGLQLLDTIGIWYEKPSSCSNGGFLPTCEMGFVFYKGATPDVKNTEWFGDGTSNATNLWSVTPQENEGKPATYYQKFCWEIPLLLLSLSQPLEHRRFIYSAELGEAEVDTLLGFVKHFNISVTLYTPDEKLGVHIIRSYTTDYAG